MPSAVEMPGIDRPGVPTEIAVFDLDRTLIPGSSLVPFGRAAVRCGLARRLDLLRNALAAAPAADEFDSQLGVALVPGADLDPVHRVPGPAEHNLRPRPTERAAQDSTD